MSSKKEERDYICVNCGNSQKLILDTEIKPCNKCGQYSLKDREKIVEDEKEEAEITNSI